MVALLDPLLGPHRVDDVPPVGQRPRLRLVGGGDENSSGPAPARVVGPFGVSPSDLVGAVLVAVVILAALVGVRVLQGGPPASTWDDLGRGSRVPVEASAGPGDHIVVARPGDTLWGLAGELAPMVDRRIAVDRLVEVNGGAAIDAGQRLVVPADLVATSP